MLVEPRVEVIRYPEGLKAGLFGHPGLPDQLSRLMLFGRQEITETRHRVRRSTG